jgi:sporulation protein YlmC with PRC-barrel domain
MNMERFLPPCQGDVKMKQTRIAMTLLFGIGVLLASVSFAAQSDSPSTKVIVPEGLHVHKASTFIGSKVENTKGENLGTIADLVLDPEAGRIKYAALSYGGVLGIGGKFFAVPWDALTLQPDGKTFLLNVDQELLETTAGFDKNSWPQRPDPMLQAAGQAPAGVAPRGAGANPGRSPSSQTEMRTEQMLSATITDLDAQQGTITLKTQTGETMDLQAPATLLTGLQAGDVVEVSRSGKQVTTIRKKNGQ